MSKLTLPLEVGKSYLDREGRRITVERIASKVALTLGEKWYLDTGMQVCQSLDPNRLVADAEPQSTEHPYAEILRAIADGKEIEFETVKSGGQWQVRVSAQVMELILEGFPARRFRIKPEAPKTIQIGDVAVPMPMRSAPKDGLVYWIVSTDNGEPAQSQWWSGDLEQKLLSDGLLHSTKEAAQAHIDALLVFSRPK